ncbi:pyruvate kinase, putative [Ricinus communis]|uniref:Pyruvate kinase n=1 Tax=Ricinus communis TaxID=3988 RepID=B9ST42_RICCO|nr:pyruvate kinase, putative [Ricinus communis]|eukprot:XP_002529161.1 pyruvate kinase 1, cytosolic [Ricinus communis]
MQGGHMVVEEPLRLSSILTPSKPSYLPSLTKIVGTLGPKSRSVETIEACLNAGMSVARFDFSWLDVDYHQETLNNLRQAMRNAKKLCAVMVDTVGPELPICNQTVKQIELKADNRVTITSDVSKEPSAEILPVNFSGLSQILKKGDTVFLGQYLFTGSENTSVWLEVLETNGKDVVCLVKNSATLTGFVLMHISQVLSSLPTLTDNDKKVISEWGSCSNVDIISLSYTRNVEDVRELRAFIKTHSLHETQVFAKIETVEGLKHFDEILQEADGIILGRGNLGIDLPPEKVFLFQKSAVYKCNMAGKPVIISRVVDSMTANLRPTRAEATDVANAVLDGADGILLGAETLRGLYPIDTIRTVGRICAEAEIVCNHSFHFKRISRHVGEPMSHAESVASSAVRAAIKVKAPLIVVFTSSGAAPRLIAKYRPPVPVFAVVIPRLRSNTLKWSFTGSAEARQLLGVRGVYPILASPLVATSGASSEVSTLKVALDHGKSVGLLKPNDQIVVFEKIGDSSVVRIMQLPS